MDLKDEKKACELFYGAFSIYEATEFQRAVCWAVGHRQGIPDDH